MAESLLMEKVRTVEGVLADAAPLALLMHVPMLVAATIQHLCGPGG